MTSQPTASNPLHHVIPTEQVNPRTADIDLLSTTEILQKINAEDQGVAHAVAQAIPQIAVVVDAIKHAFETGGRLFYFGAGTSGRLGVLDASECPPTYGAPPSLVQGIMAGAGPIFLFARSVMLLGGGRAATFPALVPGFALVIGYVALGIVPSIAQIIGMVIVVVGFRFVVK